MITPRLECILSHIKGDKIADIGTDHAYIPIRAVNSGICSGAVACDIRKGPCDTAARHIKKYGLEDKIEVRQGSGLCPVEPDETDIYIIAGMGGELIISILDESPDKAKARPLLLQPMNCQYELRRYLIENGFKILNEDIASEGFKVYNIIKAKKGSMKPFERDIDFHIPPYLYGHPLFNMLCQKKMREFTKISEGLKRSSFPDQKACEKYDKLILELSEICKCIT